jgi:hypothetical protein
MYARVATFEGGDAERLRQMSEERMGSGTMNFPSGLRYATLLQAEGGGRRLFITWFDSKESVQAAEQQFDQMGDEIPEDVRGKRTSVEVYEVLFEHQPEAVPS